MAELNYEQDVQIDESSLDLEWLDQAAKMLKYCRHAEAARKEMDWAKERLDIKRAELDKEIRTNPEKFDITKPTEGAIQNIIITDAGYKKCSAEYIEAKYEAGMANAAVRAFDQRKTALENLVRLHGSQYFAGPRVPRDLSDERRMQQDRSNGRVGDAMRRRRRDRE